MSIRNGPAAADGTWMSTGNMGMKGRSNAELRASSMQHGPVPRALICNLPRTCLSIQPEDRFETQPMCQDVSTKVRDSPG